MLVLSRKVAEKICIGEQGEIVITVVESRDGKVRIGVTAPANVPVDRQEVFTRKRLNLRSLAMPPRPLRKVKSA